MFWDFDFLSIRLGTFWALAPLWTVCLLALETGLIGGLLGRLGLRRGRGCPSSRRGSRRGSERDQRLEDDGRRELKRGR